MCNFKVVSIKTFCFLEFDRTMYLQSTTTKPNALTTSTFNPSEAFLLHCLPFYACNLI